MKFNLQTEIASVYQLKEFRKTKILYVHIKFEFLFNMMSLKTNNKDKTYYFYAF